MEQSQTEDIDPDNVIKIMVAGGIHLGYDEKNVRGEDSFIAFEEVLQRAVEYDVDAILLAGNLFHKANPSLNTMNRCSRLLKTYTFGDKPIKLEFLSNPNITVNYDDPNLNVAIPVFSIHGNRDDPTGFRRLGPMDLLSSNGYVNYFGKWTDLNNVNISPILLRKGATKLALYGLGHIDDPRLEKAKVTMDVPADTGWFNALVLHQSRIDRGRGCLSENELPHFLDLVIWGHEHQCRIIPEPNSKRNFFVSQPGSTVATSLSEGELKQKCCGILSIHKDFFHMEPIPLRTVRPFIFESVDLETLPKELRLDEGDVQQNVREFVTKRIEAMIERAQDQLTDSEHQPKVPLIRLHVLLTEYKQEFNAIRFGHGYTGIVANQLDMLVLKMKKKYERVDKKALEEAHQNQRTQTPEDIAEQYFQEAPPKKQLQLMCARSMTELVRRIRREDDDAADKIIEFYEKNALKFLETQGMFTKDNIDEVLAGIHEKENDMHDKMLAMLDLRGTLETASTKTTVAARGSSKTAITESSKASSVDSSSRSQISTSSTFRQELSKIPSVATRISARKPTVQRARQMSFDSDKD